MEALFDPLLIFSAVASLFLFGLVYVGWQSLSEGKSRSDVRKRLDPKVAVSLAVEKGKHREETKTQASGKMGKMAKRANDFYASSDPASIKKLRMMLIQAGYMNPSAVGYFIAARVLSAVIGLVVGVTLIFTLYAEETLSYKGIVVLIALVAGYFAPSLILSRRMKAEEQSNRRGFPDILDLMVVSAEAGLTMEASVERISAEIRHTYPNLSAQLNMTALEIRAGRTIDQALLAFGERLKLEEVRGFATMVQQSKELGTSVSDALRVYSDEMRHKRMMSAEEKAYALPAKMSVPVTVFILPIVVAIALIPAIVRLNM